MLEYDEMLTIVDRATREKTNADGTSCKFVDVENIRTELWHNWGFDHLQIENSINKMRAEGLLVDYSEGANS